jgi:thiamine biosynthesis lipoprotein
MPAQKRSTDNGLSSNPDTPTRFTRRRFLTSLGLLAGAGAVGTLAPRLSAGRLVRVEASRPGLGTWIRITARHRDGARAERAIARAFEAIARVDAQMSVHRADSELSRVNAMAGREAVHVGEPLLEVVGRAREASLASGGVFDPTVLPLMRLYGFYASGRTHLPADREIDETLRAIGADGIAIDRSARTLGLERRGAALDLGGIGKGWAVDCAVRAVRAEGVESGLVDVGRNVYALGTPDEDAEGWSVGVLHPVTGAVDRVFTLRDAAVATAGNTENFVTLDGARVGHLFDARRGRPSNPHLSASVVAATGTDSDTGSNLAFLLGRDALACLPGVLDSHFVG